MTNPNWPVMTFQADFQHGPNSGSQTWTPLQVANKTALVGFRTQRGRQYELDQVQAGTCEIDLYDFAEYLNPANTTSPFNSGSNSLLPYRQIQLQATWAGNTHSLFTGYIERYPVAWDSAGFRGIRNLEAVDGMARLSARTFDTQANVAIMSTAPDLYFPMSDPGSSQNSPGLYAQEYLSRVQPLPYLRNASGTNGSAIGGIAAPTGPWDTTWTQLTPYLVGGAAVGGWEAFLSSISALTPPWSLCVAFMVTPTGSFTGTTEVLSFWNGAQDASGTNKTGTLSYQSVTPYDYFSWSDGSGGPLYIAAQGVGAAPHMLHLTCDSSAGLVLYFDGASVATYPSALSVPAGFMTIGNPYAAQNGILTVAHVGIWHGTLLTQAQISTQAAAVLAGFGGEPTGYNSSNGTGHVSRVLSMVPYTGYGISVSDQAATAHQGQSAEYGTPWSGKTALALIQQSELTEQGMFYVGADGTARFVDRQTRRSTANTPLFTFGDGPGELPYEDLTLSLDPQHIYNNITVTQPDQSVANTIDATSITEYFPSTMSVTTDFANDADALQYAYWAVSKYAQPVLRVDTLVINPAANTALWSAALSLELGNVIAVKRRNAGVTMSANYIVENIAHDVDFSAGKWDVTLQLSPAVIQQGLILDDSTYGALDQYAISN